MTYSRTEQETIDDEAYEKKYHKKIVYALDSKLKQKTDNKIKSQLIQRDKDFFAIVDGQEGAGKSWFAFQWAKYVDNTFCLKRIVFSPEEFKEAIFKAERGQAIVYDEAFTGLGSRSSLSAINRYLVSLAMQIRQKNLFIILVLPSVFLIDKYFAMFRAKCLVHVYENKGIRGFFRVYNQRKIKLLILSGKATYSYSKKVKTKFVGRFYGKFALGDELEAEYRKRKLKALEGTEQNPMTAGQVKYKEQRDLILWLFRKHSGLIYGQISNLLSDYNLEISVAQIGQICSKFGDTKVDKSNRKKLKEELIDETEEEVGEDESIDE